MEQKQAKVVSANFKDSYIGQYGELFNFTIEFDNGDKAGYAAKSNPQNKFIPGQSVEYIIEEKNGFMKVKPVQPASNGSFSRPAYNPDADKLKQCLIVAQSTLTKVVDMVIHDKIKFEQLESSVDKLMDIQIRLAKKHKDLL